MNGTTTSTITTSSCATSSSTVLETVGGNFGGVCTIDVSGNLFWNEIDAGNL